MENIDTKTVRLTKAYGRRENHSNFPTPSGKRIVLMFDYYFSLSIKVRSVNNQSMTITRNPSLKSLQRPAD